MLVLLEFGLEIGLDSQKMDSNGPFGRFGRLAFAQKRRKVSLFARFGAGKAIESIGDALRLLVLLEFGLKV